MKSCGKSKLDVRDYQISTASAFDDYKLRKVRSMNTSVLIEMFITLRSFSSLILYFVLTKLNQVQYDLQNKVWDSKNHH